MAKISSEQRKLNQKKYDLIILDLFWSKGWNAVTYGEVSRIAGIQRSTLQNYYLDTGLQSALNGKIYPVMMELVNFDSAEEFRASWMKALEEKKFRYIVSLLIGTALSEEPNELAKVGLKRLSAMVEQKFNNKQVLNNVLGASVMAMMEL